MARAGDAELIRRYVFHLVAVLKNAGCTTLVISDPIAGSGGISRFGVEESIIDGVIILKAAPEKRGRMHYLEVYKLRGINHATGDNVMKITPRGIEVFPRLEEVLHSTLNTPGAGAARRGRKPCRRPYVLLTRRRPTATMNIEHMFYVLFYFSGSVRPEGRPGVVHAGGQETVEPTSALLERAKAGDVQATEALLERYRPLLTTLARRSGAHLVGAVLSADDLQQEACRHFLALLRAYRGTTAVGFSAYLHKALGWHLAKYVRAERRRQACSESLRAEHLDLVQDELRPNLGVSLENPRLRAALRRLSPRQRAVLFHLHCQEMAVAEIATALGLTPQAVRATRRRAERLVRKMMDG